jgi:hypothetical protein
VALSDSALSSPLCRNGVDIDVIVDVDDDDDVSDAAAAGVVTL